MQRIKLPKKVLPMLEKWYEEDISKETNVPHTFEEGYLIFENADTLDDNARDEIKYIASKTHAVYRKIETMYQMLNGKETILYFKFLNDNELYVERYTDKKYIHNEVAFPLVRQEDKKTKKIKEITSKKITTPIYDLGRTKVVSLEMLKKRKKGWTYSHAFNVRGHFRHYKSGKVVFIKPFVKCKDLETRDTEIVVSPKE